MYLIKPMHTIWIKLAKTIIYGDKYIKIGITCII